MDTAIDSLKWKALNWANQFEVCAVLDSNDYQEKYSKYQYLIAADYTDILHTDYREAFEKLEKFRQSNPGWIFGGLGYDLKNDVEKLTSSNLDALSFPDCFFFVPKYLIGLSKNGLDVILGNPSIADEIINITPSLSPQEQEEPPLIQQRFTREEYITKVKAIQQHIAAGDIYETNFCIDFYSENAIISPLASFLKLNALSKAPFSSYFKWFDKFIICASPERFLAKRGNQLISQPIKGTAKRSKNTEEDLWLKNTLQQHPKERQENVMIVDLVRNDLTKSAIKGSVTVEELFGVYSFQQVHQMISTVICKANPTLSVIDILKNTFPMGSMTGAPKIRAMQLMEHYEKTKRGIYSGALGYISPNNDFDFNVVIRSILYNASQQYLSFHAGSAITYYADAEKEYEECLLKVKALVQAVNGKLI
ncbi:anthranilate synthase component I family protein [Pseudopedobacter beijingensis]|uniref:Anthranilate synthase component I family protein n=1 Tax=Pseudopedobacter beijingensis TaxID=1207056 RepID=A0ABW4IGX8_9SPHI